MLDDKTQIGQICSSIINKQTLNTNQSTNLPIETTTNTYQPVYINDQSSNDSIVLTEYIKLLCDTYTQSIVKPGDDDLILVNLIKHIYPIILVTGIIGNFVTFITMVRIYNRRKNFQKFCFSLAALALADLFVLVIGCLREFLEIILNFDVRSSSIYSCKLIMFACYLFSCFSVYLHGFIAIERWHAVSDPIKSKVQFTFKLSKIIILSIFFTCLIINLPLLWFPTLKHSIQLDNHNRLGVKEIEECDVTDELVFISIDSVFYCLIPFLITILFSALTVIKLIQSKTSMNKSNETELLKQHISGKKGIENCQRSASLFRNSSRLDLMRYKSSSVCYDIQQRSYQSALFRPSIERQQRLIKVLSTNSSRSQTSNLKITIMLMALPISYLITTFPIFVIIIHGWITNNQYKVNNSNNFDTAYTIAKIFMYVNNSINILIYILLGKNLRKDFIAILLPFKNMFNKLKAKRLSTGDVQKNQSDSTNLNLNTFSTNNNNYNSFNRNNRKMTNYCF